MPECKGWLLDLFEDPEDDVVLYIIARDGRRLRLHTCFPVTFYARGSNTELRTLWRFLTSQSPKPALKRTRRFDAFTRQDETVLEVQVQRAYLQRPLFERVAKSFPHLTFDDADIQLSLRFAAATGVFPLAHCTVSFDEGFTLKNISPLEKAWALTPSRIPFRVMTIAPNCDPHRTLPERLEVDCGRSHYKLSLFPERGLLVNLNALLERFDPDILLTSWGDTWLLPYLLETSEKHSLPLPLNRESRKEVRWQKERSYFSYGRVVYRGQQVQLYGRCHIDRRNAVLWDDYGMEGTLEACRVTALPLQVSARSSPGTGISSIEILTALREGILVPWQKQQAEMVKPATELFLADQGGMVYQPVVGVHRNVAQIDFVSLYPSIMVNFNISPETIINDPAAENLVPTLGIGIDNSITGIVPKSLKPLLMKRITLKKETSRLEAWDPRRQDFARRASALKWLLVTCFGYLGYKNARFGRIEAHQAVTAYARELLLRAKETAEAAGYEILHMYVDALWIRKEGGINKGELDSLLEEIQLNTGVPIALDGIYRWLVFLPSRQNENRSVPNRYFGAFEDGSLKIRGIAARRGDTPGYIAGVQDRILKMLADRPEPAGAIPDIIQYLQQSIRLLKAGRIPVHELLVSQRLGRKLEAYTTLPAAARAALQLEGIGKHLRPGQRVRFVYTRQKDGVYAWDLGKAPDPAVIDVDQYVKLLIRANSEILQPWVGSEKDLAARLFASGGQLALPRQPRVHPALHASQPPANPCVALAIIRTI